MKTWTGINKITNYIKMISKTMPNTFAVEINYSGHIVICSYSVIYKQYIHTVHKYLQHNTELSRTKHVHSTEHVQHPLATNKL